jgi:D-3-phosphoglycerate dehydrogenase / 2-oxoglutarate reductase
VAKVLIAEPLAPAGIELLRRHHQVDARTAMTPEELRAAVADTDALVVRSATQVTAEVLAAARNLKVVGRAGIGLDNIDVEAATRQGVMVVNAPQSNIISAAEHTVALILAQARNIPQAHAALRAGRWERSRFQGTELYGKTVGIIGLGRVGTLVAHRLLAFGVRLLAYDPYVSAERAAQMDIELGTLEDVLARADVVTIHLPKTPETVGLLGTEQLARMKPGARLINTARGGIVDEAALAKAVESGHLAGAALDVFAEEPTTASPLFEVDSVVVTPHLGASTAEAQDKAGIAIAEQLLLALDGQFVPNAVNVDAGPVPDALRPFLPLAEKLGRLYTAIARGGRSAEPAAGQAVATGWAEGPGGQVTATYTGTIAEQDTRVLTLGVLRGMFAEVVDEPVTYVNAPLLAAERGIAVTESSNRQSRDYVNLLTVSGHGRRGPVSVSGTVVGPRDAQRLVAVGDLPVDLPPARHMAFFWYADRPGVIGAVGSLLGAAGVNIASMQVGRREAGGEALMTITVDSAIPGEVLDRIIAEIGAHDGIAVELHDGMEAHA